jgi:hypothetical protein
VALPDDLPPDFPTEIPWRLVATTRHLGPETLGPDTTAISLFAYAPPIESYDADYPDDRLIYFRFTVSVSPVFLIGSPPPASDPLDLFASDTLPIWRLLFDIRISPEPYQDVETSKKWLLRKQAYGELKLGGWPVKQ